jgi:CRP-like cAMP-binding protein
LLWRKFPEGFCKIPKPVNPNDLLDSDLFCDVSEAGRSEALGAASVRPLAKGATIFTQSQAADRAHFLLSGRVRIGQGDADGGQLLVRFIGTGESFGTLGLFTGHHYPADAVAVTDSMEASWTETAFLSLMERHPQIAINLVRIAGERLRDTENRLRELATKRVESRIAHTLLRFARKASQTTSDGAVIDFPLSRNDLAQMCGAALHTVSRTLTTWENAGWISTHQQRITIRDQARIHRLTERA